MFATDTTPLDLQVLLIVCLLQLCTAQMREAIHGCAHLWKFCARQRLLLVLVLHEY